MLPDNLLQQLRAAIITHFGLGASSNPVSAAPFDVYAHVPIAEAVMEDRRLRAIAAHLLGAESVRVWKDQVIVRPPRVGAASGWHQDFAFWPMRGPTAVTCWIPLQDVDEVTGCLRFLRGSHRWGNRPSIVPRTLDEIVASLADGVPGGVVSNLPMRLGDCDFHHGLVFHGASANSSNSYRITYKVIFMDEASELGPDVYAVALKGANRNTGWTGRR